MPHDREISEKGSGHKIKDDTIGYKKNIGWGVKIIRGWGGRNNKRSERNERRPWVKQATIGRGKKPRSERGTNNYGVVMATVI